jgi:hypothetical protein
MTTIFKLEEQVNWYKNSDCYPYFEEIKRLGIKITIRGLEDNYVTLCIHWPQGYNRYTTWNVEYDCIKKLPGVKKRYNDYYS